MNGLSLQDSQHAPTKAGQPNGGFGGERSAYIPPHMRNQPRGPAPAAATNGFDSGAGAPPMANGNGWPQPKYVSSLPPSLTHLVR